MARSMKTAALEYAADAVGAPEQQAEQISKELSFEFPNSTTRGRQRAAAAAVGSEIMSDAEMDAAITNADNKTPKRRAARAARGAASGAASGTTRQVRRTAGDARSVAKKAASPFKLASRPADLLRQSLGLVFLYWVIRTPDVVSVAARGITSAFGWLSSLSGVPGEGVTTSAPISDLRRAVFDAAADPNLITVNPDAGLPVGPQSPSRVQQPS